MYKQLDSAGPTTPHEALGRVQRQQVHHTLFNVLLLLASGKDVEALKQASLT